MKSHVDSYMKEFGHFRKNICVPMAESVFDEKLKAYRGQGYWIPELNDDVDVETVKSLLPEMRSKLAWIQNQRQEMSKKTIPASGVTKNLRNLLKRLLELKKAEISPDEKAKLKSRQTSLSLMQELKKEYDVLIKKIPFFTNFKFPVDHLKNRKVHDQYRELEDLDSIKVANYSFLYRKIMEDGTYYKDHSNSDIYLRTTLDTLYFELNNHDFYISEDARYDLEFVLSKIESELEKGKDKILERLTEWETRTQKSHDFYHHLTLPENQVVVEIDGEKTTANKVLIKEHNIATEELKEFVYKKQAEVYKYWSNRPEIERAIFVLETILINEVGGVDGEDALERMDVARVVMNRLDKPKYLVIGKKEFFYPHLAKLVSPSTLKNESWLNALFKQGEFSFTYYYMAGSSKVFCPDISPKAKKLRKKNIQIALQVLKEEGKNFNPTRYFSRASMIGRIHMDSIWEDYIPFPERPGLLSSGQEQLMKQFQNNEYTFLYSFEDPDRSLFQVLEINGQNYALSEKNGVKLFFNHRNPHYFRYFTNSRP